MIKLGDICLMFTLQQLKEKHNVTVNENFITFFCTENNRDVVLPIEILGKKMLAFSENHKDYKELCFCLLPDTEKVIPFFAQRMSSKAQTPFEWYADEGEIEKYLLCSIEGSIFDVKRFL